MGALSANLWQTTRLDNPPPSVPLSLSSSSFFGRFFFLCEYKLCHIANMAGTWCIFTPLPLWGSVYTSCIFQCSFSFLFELTSGVCVLNGTASSPTHLVHSSSRRPLCSLLNVQRVSFPSLFFSLPLFSRQLCTLHLFILEQLRLRSGVRGYSLSQLRGYVSPFICKRAQ